MTKALKHGALGFVDALAMAIAGSAPAYTITASTGALVAALVLPGRRPYGLHSSR